MKHENGETETEVKETSKLAQILKSIEGQKPPSKEEQKTTVAAFKAALGRQSSAQRALAEADAEVDAVTIGMVRCFGRAQIKVDGKRLAISSRGERLFYKNMSNEPDAVTI